ncbi:uncharacterized protein [Dermacentor albipictus]|uniref:uncharacterized protein isoform X2 n=1 Tax=Dermacentor albipictus TaxID=60249 RepID=UPI0031FDD77A
MRSSSWCLWILVAFLSAPSPPGECRYVSIHDLSQQENCYKKGVEQPEPAPRIMYVNGRAHNIVVETSQRPTQRLVTHMFHILVTELLGYRDVVIRSTSSIDPESSLQRLTGCADLNDCNVSSDHVPETMINLELWMGPSFDIKPWLRTDRITDIGPLGPLGRYGWYVSKQTAQEFWNKYNMVLDHWRSYRSANMTSQLDLLQDEKLQDHLTRGGYLCNFTSCRSGVYRSPLCDPLRDGRGVPCATLIADFPESTYALLKHQIETLKLRVNVVWIGKHLDSYVNKLLERKQPVIFFNWRPSSLTFSNHDLTRIAFPHCEDRVLQGNLDTSNCLFEVNNMERATWSKLKDTAPDVYQLVEKMTFTQQEYEKLLKFYQSKRPQQKSFHQIACHFLLDNEVLLHQFSVRVADKPMLHIGGIFPMSGIYNRVGGVLTAARMAMDSINRNENILKDFKLVILEEDGQCAQDVVMKRYINYVTNSTYKSLIGILGPACTETLEPIVGVAQHYNTPIISYSAEGALFSKREKYPYFFRTIPENHIYRFVYLKMLQALQWRRLAALTEDGHKYSEYLNLLHDDMQKLGLNFVTNRKFPHDHGTHNGTHRSQDMSQYLADLKSRNARIIIGGFDEDAARAIMCEAYRQGMTGRDGYQWFLPTWLSQQEQRHREWYNTEYYNQHFNESVNCTVGEMKVAIDGYMSLHPKAYADDNATMQDNKTVAFWKETYKQIATGQGREDSDYGGYAYDAVWVFALAVDALFKKNHSYTSSIHEDATFKELIRLINATDFHGVTGHVRFYRSSRLTDVIIRQWVNGSQHHVGTYSPGVGDEGDRLALGPSESLSAIHWPAGRNQGDGGEDPVLCPLEGLRRLLNTSCDLAIVVANVIGLSLFALLMIGGCVVFKRRYEEKVKQTEARMRELGLLTSNHLPSLDGWEMPRDHIVINRKLGEGAFGTVYGGEALVTDQCWQAVAVKTLKVGAIIEEKLDFLSEAEMMKRFDHKNIVRLLGVCTTGEPVYTVMEFMLYGDLKTYLLARRHLVKENERHKSEEVSDRCLTAMALDVARGLSYLADLKYVHRDLACRNCLVNAGRTVKIGDFGMCRPMYDSDYYRFNKRGMLPVRWMAPESLNDGIFTTMSDVWSYGVLLYEIITFASFPYQGLSNNQVLEYVKGYKTLPVPNGCKPELEALLLRCWARSPSQRPTACEIVEILANDSKLISPCLDQPPASVQVEGTDSLELTAIGDRGRLHSISSLARRVESVERSAAVVVGQQPQQPGSPVPPPRNQYVTLRQLSRTSRLEAVGCNMTPLPAYLIHPELRPSVGNHQQTHEPPKTISPLLGSLRKTPRFLYSSRLATTTLT